MRSERAGNRPSVRTWCAIADPPGAPGAQAPGRARRGLGKVRRVVERAFAWLHQFKRLRVRYERRADITHGL
ncbi:transposase [Streptomyces azureus]|uniref:Transposase n=1 Tax=Streptomyces azureus TaxID=146537 RepID=A0A0K8PJR4_STRAJ|nr:transposase [Streptomyces azureus]